MNFDEVINNRRSARLFTDDIISEKQLEKILFSASLAPSAKNRQPWKFYLLSDEQKTHIMNMLYMSLQALNLGLGSCILCDTLYIEHEINEYLGINNFEQICGFIIGKPIYTYPPKTKKHLKDLLLN
ncbi:MAG: nitroreductase family protein [Clostridia bacterium]|jgi:nitroreductase|nr:nitroreductase family protein [Clostridia bacterium]